MYGMIIEEHSVNDLEVWRGQVDHRNHVRSLRSHFLFRQVRFTNILIRQWFAVTVSNRSPRLLSEFHDS